MKSNANIAELESILGYSFNNKELLRLALTHSSYASGMEDRVKHNNERLEFIGDGYLDAVIGNRVYDILDDAPEGVLSKTRAGIVCEGSLAGIARKLRIGEFLRLGKGEIESRGYDKDSILADAVESIIGAIAIDSSFESAREFILRICEENINLAINGKLFRDYKTELQERLQEKYRNVHITYDVIAESGPDHCKEFIVQVSADGRTLGQGTGRSKKLAAQNAACDVILKGEF